MSSITRSNQVTDHFRRVQEAMEGYGQETPDNPHCPTPQVLLSRARMLLEEVFEFLDAAGVHMNIKPCTEEQEATEEHTRITFEDLVFTSDPGYNLTFSNIHDLLDAVGDISVVNTGTLVACGFPDKPLLELIDANNLMKIANGKMNPDTGKFEKHPNHTPPNIGGFVRRLTKRQRRLEQVQCCN